MIKATCTNDDLAKIENHMKKTSKDNDSSSAM